MAEATGSSSAPTLLAAVPGHVVRPRRQHLGTFALSMLSVGLGVVAGVGAFAFRALIGLLHNLFFLGRFSWLYDSNNHTPPGPWGPPGAFTLAVPFLPLTRPMTRDALSMLASWSSWEENLSLQPSHSSQESHDRFPMPAAMAWASFLKVTSGFVFPHKEQRRDAGFAIGM